jgi:hypothetical protein
MIFKLSNLPKFFFTYICPTFYGGSAPATPSTTTQNINSIPPELMPYVLGNLQAAKGQLFKTDASGQITGYQDYKPYSTDPNKYVAGFSALQKQAQQGAGALKMPGQFATATGMATSAGQGALGAGDQYNQMATDPGSMSQWMSPYMENVVDYQTQQANRQYDISGAAQMGNAARSGAFGGSRDAIMAAENARNRNQAITGIQATGAQTAWQDARQAQQFGANLGLQGYQTAIQGSQQLGNLGTQQLAAQTDILGTKSKYGAEVQGRNQALIDQRIKNFENQQNQPYRAMDVMSGLVRGIPINQSSSTAYAANPSYGQQIGSTIGALGSMYGAYKGKANGGIVQAYADGGSVEQGIKSKLRDMSPEQLRAHIPEITSQEELSIAKKILAEETMSQYARGGIVGYAEGGQLGWREQLESTQQEMKANDYKLHGWTDEDIANYESSGRVPLDPKKQLALRDVEPAPRIPLDKDTYYRRLQEIGRRVPEEKVIRLPDENAVKSEPFKNVGADKGITGYRPPAEEYVPPKFGGNLESPAVEGEYLGKEIPSSSAPSSTAQQEPISGEKGNLKYGEFTEKEYAERMKARADAMSGTQRPMNAGQAREDILNKAKAGESFSPKEGVAGPSPEAPVGKDSWKAPAGESPVGKNIAKGITSVKGAMKDLAKGAGKVLLAPENIAMMGSDINAQRFEESLAKGDKGATSTALSAILGSPQVVQNLLKHGTGGDLGEQFRKQNPALASAIDEAGDSVAERYQVLKQWMTTPIVGREEKPEATGLAQTTADQFVAPEKKGLETISDMGAPTPSAGPRVGLGQTAQAQEGKVYPQEISKVYREKGLDLPVQSTAYQPAEEAAQPVAQQAPVDDGLSEDRATAAKTPLQILQERQAEMEKAGIRSSDQISAEQRKEIMAEKANAQDESKRQMYLRMAEFFSNWGSTPGLPLVAGLKAMKETLPSVMSDSKEDHAVMRSINKSLRDLEHATELEKAGKYNEAYAIKEQASERIRKHDEHVADLGARREELNKTLESHEKTAKIAAGASMYGADERASRAATGDVGARYNASPDIASLRDIREELKGIDAKIEDVSGSKSPEDVAMLKELQATKKELLDEKVIVKNRMDSRGMSEYASTKNPSPRVNKNLSTMSQEERFAQQSKLGK